MKHVVWALLVIGCGEPAGLLGGQEGEPVAPPAEAPIANDDAFDLDPSPAPPPDNDGDGLPDCDIAAHCNGAGWCAEYGVDSVPDLEAECEGSWAAGPCERSDGLATCPLGLDPCSQVYIYAADLTCEDVTGG